MAKIVLKNPNFEEEITVRQDCRYISNNLGEIVFGNLKWLELYQTEPREGIITINPELFAKIEFYEELEDD